MGAEPEGEEESPFDSKGDPRVHFLMNGDSSSSGSVPM